MRCDSSRLPGPNCGSNFWNCTSVAPNDWKSRDDVVVEAVDDRDHGDDRGHADDDAEDGERGAEFVARSARAAAKRTFSRAARMWSRCAAIDGYSDHSDRSARSAAGFAARIAPEKIRRVTPVIDGDRQSGETSDGRRASAAGRRRDPEADQRRRGGRRRCRRRGRAGSLR